MTPAKVRALVAIGMGHNRHGLVLATDSPWLASDIEGINDFADDLGLDTRGVEDSGLFLWEGTVKTVSHDSYDGYEPETEYTGTMRAVTAEELPVLLAMEPDAAGNCPKKPESSAGNGDASGEGKDNG